MDAKQAQSYFARPGASRVFTAKALPATGAGKVRYLEGLRGIAAIQVVAMHFVTGFLPATEANAWPPSRLLFDGHTAVYVFFLISGAVLTPSLSRPGPMLNKIAKRIVRLGLPVAAASVLALALIAMMPQLHRAAAALSGSPWLAMDSSGAPTLAHLAREVGLDSILIGYRDSTLFAPIADRLPPMSDSLDAPFWSLHLEFYGSLLVLALVSLRSRSLFLHGIGILAAAAAFGTDPMFLFVIGHLSATRLGHRAAPRGRIGFVLSGVVLLALGAALCATKDWAAVEWLRLVLSAHEASFAPNLFQFQSQLGAVALYFGVVLCGAVWPLLESRPLQLLGRLSFSIYLVHFPIMFTLVCAYFVAFWGVLPSAVLIASCGVVFVAVTLAVAIFFERWVDRPAIALARRFDPPR
jgi:peptidoglycan/LPS O-acetylase OafA/YrhL